jgi:hypothetical protein
MRKEKILPLMLVAGWMVFICLSNTETASGDQKFPFPASTFKSLEPFYGNILETVTHKSIELIYDYDHRPIIGTIVSDFADTNGQVTEIGQDLSRFLRAGLSREIQFDVYGKAKVNQTLGHFFQPGRELSPAIISNIQDTIPTAFKNSVHLVITGSINKTEGNQITVSLSLIPIFKPLRSIEKEGNYFRLEKLTFLSNQLDKHLLEKAFSRVDISNTEKTYASGFGRLVILSNYLIEKTQERDERYLGILESSTAMDQKNTSSRFTQIDIGDPGVLSCWLNSQELFVLDPSHSNSAKGFYHNILGGFEADHIWLDAEVKGGDHQLAFSVFPGNSLHKKAVSYPFKLKPGATTFLVVSVVSRPQKDPDIAVRMIVDPDNKGYPF